MSGTTLGVGGSLQRFYICLSVIIFVGCSSKLVETPQPSADRSLAYQLVESLTTEVGARPAGSEAEKRARDWGVTKMKSLGLKNVRIETFDVDHWQRLSESCHVISPAPQNLRITALGSSVSTPKNGLVGEVVKVGNLEELKSKSVSEIKNNIVFIDEKMDRAKDGAGYAVAVQKRYEGAIEAGKKQASALLIRSVGTDSHRFPHTGLSEYDDTIKKVPMAALSNPDADQLQRLMKKGIVKLNLNIQTRQKGKKQSGNVIGEIPGRGPEIVVIGAHLDSWDLAPGALDDGAGVAIVMAAAAKIIAKNQVPERTIRVILFGAEEVGLVGAKAYAQKHEAELSRHFLGSESDFGARKVWSLDTGFTTKDYLNIDELLDQLKPLGIVRGHDKSNGGPDMVPLKQKNVSVIRLEQDGTDYFDYHHTEDDTLDKINVADLEQNVEAWSIMTWWAANVQRPIP